jgi:HPt (histidine-containing phosphotransfer) domain-containing protein
VPDKLPLLSIHEGNSDLQPIIPKFLETVTERLSEMKEAITQNKIDDLKSICHKFRGSASTFGFPQVATSIVRVEDCFIQFKSGLTPLSKTIAAYNRLVHQCSRLSTNGWKTDVTQFQGISEGD